MAACLRNACAERTMLLMKQRNVLPFNKLGLCGDAVVACLTCHLA